MRLKKSYEQAICVLLMLALSKNQRPLKSYIFSKRLEVSDSYLKKVLRQLVVGKLVQSEASKSGGFVLGKAIEEITMLDVYRAIEGNESLVQYSKLAEKVFIHEEHITQKEDEIISMIKKAEASFLDSLRNVNLASLLINKYGHNVDQIDWYKAVQ